MAVQQIVLIAVVLFIGFVAAKDTQELRCYECDQRHESCLDPVKTADLATVTCKDLNYGSAKIESLRSMARSNSKIVGYNCVKIKTHNATLGQTFVERSCVELRENIADTCAYLKDEIKGLKSCDVCDGEFCNGAVIPTTSAVLFGALIASILCIFL